jgi:two-component system, chemotaxis family, sensor kinase CheA
VSKAGKKTVNKNLSSRMQGARAVWVAVGILALAFLVGVLAPAWYFAGRLVDNNTAVRAIGELQQQPSRMQAALNSIQDRLRARGFVRDSIEQLKRATQQFETATASIQGGGSSIGGFGNDDDVRSTINEMTQAWKKYQPALAPVANFTAIPYSDSEREGTTLNVDGRELQQKVTQAVTQARVYTPQLEKNLAQVIAGLQSSSDSLATALRTVVLIGVGLAGALAALVGYLTLARGKQAAVAAAAKQQTEDILSTVREGLFLLDGDLKIGTIHSHATAQLFQRESVSGLTFEELLRDLVSPKTLQIATKFVKVLWSERTKENLIRSINPLNEVELVVKGEKGDKGGGETRYLEFNFHRVRREGAITHVLVSVADVTARVALAAQLKGAQDNAQHQMDAFLSILHVDPVQLSSFLDDSDVAFKMINATLRDPARDSASFRRKIDGLFRQIHSIKGEASAIGLGSMEARAHALESDLAGLRERTDLSGDDFLPLLTKFDDLVSHSQSVRDMVTKLASFRDSFGKSHQLGASATSGDSTGRMPKITEDAVAAEATLQRSAREGFVASAQQLADRIATDHGKKVIVTCKGHDQVPESYRRPVKDVLIQLIRNSVVHGIEKPADRQAQGKSPEGHIRINFELVEGGRAFRMTCEDDGRGLTPEKLRKTAITKGIISQNDAAALSDQEAMMLVFRSGFSTANEVTRDAGRGVGMDVIAEIAARLGGRISLNSEIGKNMKLSLSFPAEMKAAGVVAA